MGFVLPHTYEVFNYIFWRQKITCEGNSVTAFAKQNFTFDERKDKTKKELMELFQQKDILWEETPKKFRWGSFIKMEKYTVEGMNPTNQQNVKSHRKRLLSESFCMEKYSPVFVNYLLNEITLTEPLSTSKEE